ncbi:hypothetical protein TeGR_g14185 [Tetraparma gracilis]|uniref:Protein kinase domain-containing protein n=1 Tax=Tetraparma gracilis TaxID=2962635 RepID=A0ABQ6MEI4_9STRA|nr:hypothetical protein TeGR_g14185 [Tetraparma gracilis]
MFLFYYSPYSRWAVAAGCGMTGGIAAYGEAGWYPFEDTAATWTCSNNGAAAFKPVTIECSFYDDQPIPCSPGKYEPAGEAPGGDCASDCPSHLPTSPPGSTSLSSCMKRPRSTHEANFLLVSETTDRLMELNNDASDFSLAIEGGDLRRPWGVACVSEILCLVGNYQASNVVAVNLRGEVMGVFARVGNPVGLLHIKHLDLLAVAGYAGYTVFLFDLADLNLEQPLEESDAVQTIVMPAWHGKPRYISLGEHDSELLITTHQSMVLRRCLEGTGCDPETRNSVMMQYGGLDLYGIGVLDETYIFVDWGDGKIFECPLTSVGIMKFDCEIFANEPQGSPWDPIDVLVDPIKRLVFVVSNYYSDVLVLDFDGQFLAPLTSSRGALMHPDAMAQRPGLFAPLSPSLLLSSLPAAGERIEVALVMMDAYNFTVSADHSTSAHDLALEVSASGYITGTNFTTTIEGEILYNKDSPAHASLTASVVIPYAGDWSVSVTQGTYNVQHFLGSPHLIKVAPAPTAPANCEADFPILVKAGSNFTATVSTFDAFENPTVHPGDSFTFKHVGENASATVFRDDASTVTFSELMTSARSYKLNVTFADTGAQIANSPLNFDVFPASASAATSTASAGNTTSIESATDIPLPLQAFIRDAFGNEVLDAPGVAVQVQGLDPVDPVAVVVHVLEGPRYSHTVTVPESLEAALVIGFSLDGVQIGEPVEIIVAPPPPDFTKVYIAVGVSSFLLLVGAFFYRRHLKHAAMRLKSVQLEMVDQNKEFSKREKALEAEKEELEEEVRLKKHSEEELKVMMNALEAVSKERQDELKEVMIDGKELKIDKMLGKGGFGVVNLATYRGSKVAMKQLLTVNEENVLRFRLECFLTKTLSHPNVVRLVGVVWAEDMFACCLEFVENGSLEDWLRRTPGGKAYIPPQQVVTVVKKNKKGKKVQVDKLPPLAEVVFKGFNHHGKYKESALTETDKSKATEAIATLDEWWASRDDPSAGWIEVLQADDSPLELGVRGFTKYDAPNRRGCAFASGFIDAPPKSVMGFYADRRHGGLDVDIVERTYLLPPLAEVAYKGFNWNSKYDKKEITDIDETKIIEGQELVENIWRNRMNPKEGLKPVLNEDGSELELGVKGFVKYSRQSAGLLPEALAHAVIDATPQQVMGLFADSRKDTKLSTREVIESTYTTALEYRHVPVSVATVSDRDFLFRTAHKKIEEGVYVSVSYSVEDERRPAGAGGVVRGDTFFCFVVKENPGTEGLMSEVWRYLYTDSKFQKGLGQLNQIAANKALQYNAEPLVLLKKNIKLLLDGYEPPLVDNKNCEQLLTWKGHLWRMSLEAAMGVQYLHHHRYWSDGGKRHNWATNVVEEEEAGWKESVIHRDLKPDNMLLTRDWTLKLTDFGEARAQNMGATMTSVGTPIYIAPEVMRADHYDGKADTWSYGLCLVAMIRAERTLEQFFYEALRKHKKRRTTKGLGMGQMTKYYYSEGWRPLLPHTFVRAFPKLNALIQECWVPRARMRPDFDQIVKRLQGEIGDEIKRKEEPVVVVYSVEPDAEDVDDEIRKLLGLS